MWGLLQPSTGDRQAFPHPLPTGRRAGGAEMAEDVCGDVGGGEARELVVWRPVEGREAHGGGPLPADPEGLVQDPSNPPPSPRREGCSGEECSTADGILEKSYTTKKRLKDMNLNENEICLIYEARVPRGNISTLLPRGDGL